MIIQFQVTPELQQYLQGVPSKKLVNVLWDKTVPAGDLPALPFNPAATHRSILFDKSTPSDDATPVYRFQTFIQNVDGSGVQAVSVERGL